MKRVDVFYWLKEFRNRYDTVVSRAKCERVGARTRFNSNIVIIGGKAGGGRGILIGPDCTFHDFCVLVTDHYDKQCGIEIGRNCHFNFGCYLSGTGGLTIGDNCLFAPDVKLITGGHNFQNLDRLIIEQGINRGRVLIEDNVWIGAGAIILPNVRIGTGSVVAAGSVVTKAVEPNSVVAGNPAALIKVRGPYKTVYQ